MGYSMSGDKLEIRTEIEIDAAASAVWSTLVDFEAYPRWNPFIAAVYGKLQAGERLSILMTPPEGREVRYSPRLLVVEPECELRWLGSLGAKFLFRTEHFFRLQSTGPSRTRLTHGEDVSGMLTRYMGAAITRIARGCVGMNLALKRRVEAGEG